MPIDFSLTSMARTRSSAVGNLATIFLADLDDTPTLMTPTDCFPARAVYSCHALALRAATHVVVARRTRWHGAIKQCDVPQTNRQKNQHGECWRAAVRQGIQPTGHRHRAPFRWHCWQPCGWGRHVLAHATCSCGLSSPDPKLPRHCVLIHHIELPDVVLFHAMRAPQPETVRAHCSRNLALSSPKRPLALSSPSPRRGGRHRTRDMPSRHIGACQEACCHGVTVSTNTGHAITRHAVMGHASSAPGWNPGYNEGAACETHRGR